MRKLTQWQLKDLPREMAKPLRYAVQHFESFHIARMETEDSLVSAALLPAIHNTLSMVDSQNELAEMFSDSYIRLAVYDASQIAVCEMAIVAWAIELAKVDPDTTIRRECDALARAWDNAEWRNAK